MLGVLGAALLSGCYNYVPVERPTPGTTVRIRVPLQSAVANPNAPPQTLDVEGLVLASGDSLIIETETRREFGAFRAVVELDTLRVARSGVVSVDQQVYSRAKTYALTALIVAGTAGLVVGLFTAAGGERGGRDDGGSGTQGAIRLGPIIFQGLLGAIGR